MASVGELLQYGKKVLMESGNEYAKYEGKVLLEEVLGITYLQMLMNEDMPVSQKQEQQYRDMLDKRCNHYPLQYILGYTYFMDYTFMVEEGVLIPRNDTEVLVELADKLLSTYEPYMKKKVSLLDMCCGSGCIGISLKLYHKELALSLCDVSKKALSVTKKNLEKYEIQGTLTESNLFRNVDGKFSMIVCNPPYIESEVIPTLMPEVKNYEPMLALDGGTDGLDFYKSIIKEAPAYMEEKGYLIFEIGYNQGQAVRDLMCHAGFCEVQVQKDYAGLDRVVYGHL